MIRGACFIVFSDDWGRHPFSCMHLMRQFLLNNRILWVNTIGMRRPRFTLYDFWRSVEKIGSWFGRSTSKEKLQANLMVISPVMIPYSNIPSFRTFNRISVIHAVRKEMKRLRFDRPILLTTLPNAVDYIGSFGEVIDIYYCVDEFSKWPGVMKGLVEETEKRLIQKADLIVATSEELQKSKNKSNISTYLLTHGVDISHFESSKSLEPVPSITKLRKPVIGYFGLFDERSDAYLIEYLAVSKPEWSFVFIGPVKVDLETLKKNSNLHFFPPVTYNELPKYLAGIDVYIIPYKVNELSRYINPLKLKECLATGKPVVSTPLPEVLKLREAVRIGWTKEEFLEEISEALSKPIDRITVEKILKGEDWSFKAEQMSQYIEEAINRKSSSTC